MNKPSRSDPPTVDRLRSDIDEGRTGDKVRYPDPAAAPLGSDDEAAGTPPTEEQRKREVENLEPGAKPERHGRGTLFLYALLIVGIALVVFGAYGLLQA